MSHEITLEQAAEKALQAEATPDGLLLEKRLLGYPTVIRHLDNGIFDNQLSVGFGVIAELSLAETRGWFIPDNEQRMIVWRWMVAGVFIVEQMKKNGTIPVMQDDGTTSNAVRYVGENGGIVVYPATERFSLARNVEELAFEQFTHDSPHQKAVMIYQSMLEESPDGGMTLSKWGRDGMAMLHDGFIEMLNTEGMPGVPTAH